jgi:hypothetical protein
MRPRSSPPICPAGWAWTFRKSIVLYDRNYLFNYALDSVPNERTLRKLYHHTPVRYWSKDV